MAWCMSGMINYFAQGCLVLPRDYVLMIKDISEKTIWFYFFERWRSKPQPTFVGRLHSLVIRIKSDTDKSHKT